MTRPKPKPIGVHHAVEVLNRALEADPGATQLLADYRVVTNETMAADPTVQCGKHGGGPTVGLLGILNGIFGAHPKTGWGWIAAQYDDDMVLTRFVVIDPVTRQPTGSPPEPGSEER